jgi:UDP-N-acetyl-D-mannosaminuronic acid dehydrogenase
MRGAPITPMMPVFARAGVTVLGHDPMVSDDVIRRHGGEPVDLAKAFREADGVLVLNDHPDYRALRIGDLIGETSESGRLTAGSAALRPLAAGDIKPLFVYDSWRILDEAAVTAAGVRYAGLGYRPDGGSR